eukprot:1110300-Pleurochrysis_carterae.AAC.3
MAIALNAKYPTDYEVDKFIGLKVTRDRNARTVPLSQELYIKKMADRLEPAANKSDAAQAHCYACMVLDKAQRTSKHVHQA